MVDDGDDHHESGNTLHVIDIQPCDISQSKRLQWQSSVSAGGLSAIVDGDELYIAGFGAPEVVVLQIAEAFPF